MYSKKLVITTRGEVFEIRMRDKKIYEVLTGDELKLPYSKSYYPKVDILVMEVGKKFFYSLDNMVHNSEGLIRYIF